MNTNILGNTFAYWNQIKSRWLPQLISQHKHVFKAMFFRDIELEFDMVGAGSHSQYIF